jgi:hypothetical protein
MHFASNAFWYSKNLFNVRLAMKNSSSPQKIIEGRKKLFFHPSGNVPVSKTCTTPMLPPQDLES